jgi:hypothetical protein
VLLALLTLPFLPLILLARLAVGALTVLGKGFAFVFRSFAHVLGFFAKSIVKVAPIAAGRLGTASAWAARHAGSGASQALKRSSPVMDAAIALASRMAKEALSAGTFAAKWVASVKDDFSGDQAREINPASLVAKLLVIALASTLSIIVAINLIIFSISFRR